MPEKKDVIIEAANVGYGYRPGESLLSAVSFSVERGDFFGIIGTNGSGKTTLLKIILGLLRPSSGEVRLFGEDPARLSARGRIGYVSQDALRFDRNFPTTALEAVLMGRIARAGLLKRITAADRKKALFALKEVGLAGYGGRRVGDMSGGEQQRVMIARALAGDPELMILDEPTLGVDVNAEAEFYSLLKHLNIDHKMTLVVVTHDIDIIGHQVNKLMCLHCSIATHGAPKEFLEGEALHVAATGNVRLVPHHDNHLHEGNHRHHHDD
jgi:zinc transport system ATP-binding protein